MDDRNDEVTSDAERRAETLSSVLTHSAWALVVGFFLLMILQEFGMNIGPLLACAGAAGVALGYGTDPDRTFEVLLAVGRKLHEERPAQAVSPSARQHRDPLAAAGGPSPGQHRT